MKKVTVEQAIGNVRECISSVFTKEDVINLLQSLELKSNITKSCLVEFITDYVEKQVNELDCQDIIDHRSVEFSLQGNEICLENVEVDSDDLSRNILGEIDDSVDTFLKLMGE
jgi:hypothetical protein